MTTDAQPLSAEDAAMYNALADLLPDAAPVILSKLTAMLSANKRARLQRKCAKCGCSHIEYADVDDSAAAERVLRLVWEYGKGKPRAMEAAESGPQIVINRTVGGVDNAPGTALGERAQGAEVTHTRVSQGEPTPA